MKIVGKQHYILSQKKRSSKLIAGFTLIELMIVCGVIAIIAAASGLTINNQMPKYRLKGDTRTLSSNLMLARMKATSSGVQYALQFDLDEPQGYNLQRGNASTGSTSWSNESYHREISNGVRINSVEDDGGTSVSGSSARIIYNPNGSSGTGEVVLWNGAGQYRVTLTPATGRVQTIRE